MKSAQVSLQIRNAGENNLKSIDVDIPLNQFIVVTGISGSGKSSLAFDVIVREGQRRYLESVPGFARRFSGKLMHPAVDSIENLPPVIAISQKAVGGGSRSTLGTMSDLYDYLRLLFARIGVSKKEIKANRSLFSFNSPAGACPHCTGLGLEEKISLDKLIADPTKSLREGALAPTLPTGYIMYTQLTMDSMDLVCRAHGFSVDVPWNEMTEEQQGIVLYGSDKIKVPIGKHSLESRLKWEGIAAKPREEDYYKGIINIMSDILRRDRNKNILKYVESLPCSHCHGTRLNTEALSFTVHEKNIAELSALELSELKLWLSDQVWSASEEPVAIPIINAVLSRIVRFEKLGMGHLTLDRPTESLSMGDTRRIRLINQITAGLSDVLYVFDEAFVGLHPHDHRNLLEMMRELVSRGNTVMLVEHDEQCIRQADYIVDIGPLAGRNGGELLFSGSIEAFLSDDSLMERSLTAKALREGFVMKSDITSDGNFASLKIPSQGNLKDIDFRLKKSALNVLTGLSGSGVQELVYKALLPEVNAYLEEGESLKLQNFNGIKQVHVVSRQPIGRTPRSNPATYTKLSDAIRDVFASEESAKEAGFKKSHFSFNTKGGRCETCQGAGKIQIGMHFLGNVDLPCPECKGKRFKSEILEIQYQGKSIADVYDMTVNQAAEFFQSEKKIMQTLNSLQAVGLGYLTLGQSSTTLSGGEAQRVKLAAYLKKAKSSKALFVLDEPANGLHHYDIQNLLSALDSLKNSGNTILCIAHNPEFLSSADYITEMGPGRGKDGGQIVAEGSPEEIIQKDESKTAALLSGACQSQRFGNEKICNKEIRLRSVTTHNLKGIDVNIPKGKITVVAGVSGSGKSSLAFDTIAAEAEYRFNESMSAYARSFLKQANEASFESVEGLNPVMSLSSSKVNVSERSTVGTMTGLYDYYRLLFSRLSQVQGKFYTAQDYSFNHQTGACELCKGLGAELVCNPDALISNPELSVLDGALKGSTAGRYFGNPDGQFVAILSKAAEEKGLDISPAYSELSNDAKELILYGSSDTVYELDWHFKNKSRSGVQHLSSDWPGFCHYIEDEFRRKHQNKTGDKLRALMHEVPCSECQGMRLQKDLLDVELSGLNISKLSQKSIADSMVFFDALTGDALSKDVASIFSEIRPRIMDLMQMMTKLGIGYLSLDRKGNTLSGGEMQRVRLAGALSSPLHAVTYVLDEPSASLHQDDIPALIEVLKAVRDRGNTLILVEHDERFMRIADHIIEMGPGAGFKGGQLISEGDLTQILKKDTPTAKYLSEGKSLNKLRDRSGGFEFGVKSAHANNLKNINVNLVSGRMIAVSGVSGSGKSSLIQDVIQKSLYSNRSVNCEGLFGFDLFDEVKFINQRELNANVYSSVFTAVGLMDKLRDFFASSMEAKAAGLKKSAFSYVHKDGKCHVCNGYGVRHLAMDFMNDLDVPCEACGGFRYKDEVLKVKVQGKHIGEVLQMPLSELRDFVKDDMYLTSAIEMMEKLGLSHLTAGQSLKSLSAGEKQRVKLLTELCSKSKGQILYIFDEPAAGLHHSDILKLIRLFQELLDDGHTILAVEHRKELLQVANQNIVLGPGAGEKGGELLTD